MDHFINLYQIAIERHNDRLEQAAQARLRRIAMGGHGSDHGAEGSPAAKASFTRTAFRKMTAILNGLAAGLLILNLTGWGVVTFCRVRLKWLYFRNKF